MKKYWTVSYISSCEKLAKNDRIWRGWLNKLIKYLNSQVPQQARRIQGFNGGVNFSLPECHIHHWSVNYFVALWHWRRGVINFVFVIVIDVIVLISTRKKNNMRTISTLSVSFIGYWVLKHEFSILVANSISSLAIQVFLLSMYS